MNIGNNLNVNNNQLLNILLQNLASDPTGIESKIYYNTVSKKVRFYNGTVWADVGPSVSGDVVGPASSVDGEIALFDSTTGKLLKRATTTGLLKATSGVLAAAVVGTDYVTGSSTNTFTNKTFDANGTGNSLTNIETADFAANVIDNDAALTANSSTRLATQQAVKAYADGLLAANDAMRFRGVIDASTNPNYPAANAGDTYKISVAGKIGGVSGIDVTVGDTLYCTLDGSSAGNHATVGANWTIVQANVDRATTSSLGLAEYADSTEAEAKSSTLVALTPASVVNFPVKKTFLIGNGSSTALTVTHNLNTKNIAWGIRKVSNDEQWITAVTCPTVNTTTFTFSVAPTSNEFEVTVIG